MSDDAYANAVLGSKLKLKRKKKDKGKEEVVISKTTTKMDNDDLTEAERRHKKRALQKRKDEVAKVVEKTHRERVDEFNDQLGSLTEHNDIPRISAAGNG